MLCQPDSDKSCGACCGLYNWKDHSRAALEALLCLQTDLFFAHADLCNLRSYLSERNRRTTNTPLFASIYNCEYLGFVDSSHRRVGCLLHPAVTGDPSLRSHCFYGPQICNDHFCPGFGCLTAVEQQAVVHSITDWYLYGLIITDIDLVKGFFKHIEERMGDSVRPARLLRPAALKALSSFFKLKVNWKFRARENRLGKYYFSEAEYHIARIDYQSRWGRPPSRFDKILVSLESELATEQELREAEAAIEEHIQRFIAAYESRSDATGLSS